MVIQRRNTVSRPTRDVDRWKPAVYQEDEIHSAPQTADWQKDKAAISTPTVDESSRRIALSENALMARQESRLDDALVKLLQQHSVESCREAFDSIRVGPYTKIQNRASCVSCKPCIPLILTIAQQRSSWMLSGMWKRWVVH